MHMHGESQSNPDPDLCDFNHKPTPRSILHHAPSYTTLHPTPRSILHHAPSYTTLHPTPRYILHHAPSYILHPVLHPASASDRMQFASDLTSDLRFSLQTDLSRDPGLLWSQSMVPNQCFRKRQPFFAHNFKGKSIRYSILSLQVAFLSSATL